MVRLQPAAADAAGDGSSAAAALDGAAAAALDGLPGADQVPPWDAEGEAAAGGGDGPAADAGTEALPPRVQPAFYRKDANEVLVKDGPGMVKAFLDNAEPFPIRGLLRWAGGWAGLAGELPSAVLLAGGRAGGWAGGWLHGGRCTALPLRGLLGWVEGPSNVG